ncbi:MAG TPA: hypothetical protein VMC80_00395 [Patescibacteria group bacterium]|nr:hypothetical protein [Patescibacteria group bacterium]
MPNNFPRYNYINHNNYNIEQGEAMKGVIHAINVLFDYENLQQQAKQPRTNHEELLNGTAADIHLQNYPPHDILKERLREQVVGAIRLGLEKDPLVAKCTKLFKLKL